MSGYTGAVVYAFAVTASAASAIYSGQQQKKAADTQAQIAENDAAYASDAARAHAEKIRKAGRAQRGEAKAALASSGVKLGEGTALEVDKAIIQNSEQDALSAILSGDRALKSGDDQASMLRASGQDAQNASVLQAGGMLLSAGWKASAKSGSKT